MRGERKENRREIMNVPRVGMANGGGLWGRRVFADKEQPFNDSMIISQCKIHNYAIIDLKRLGNIGSRVCAAGGSTSFHWR